MDWEYSPAPESECHWRYQGPLSALHRWNFKEGNGEDRDTINPGTGKRLSTVSTVNAADIDRAVNAARRLMKTSGHNVGR